MSDLLKTPLFDLHEALGAKMVPFAGYAMPVQYPMGVMKEHTHTRAGAGLFDVSHMGQISVDLHEAGHEAVALALESIIPQDVLGLKAGRQRYGFLTNSAGGIEDDLMFANTGDYLQLVVNGARKHHDIKLIRAAIKPVASVTFNDNAPLLALQGPRAEDALASLVPEVRDMNFMDAAWISTKDFGSVFVTRSGYTGEDGFEIAPKSEVAVEFARALLNHDDVEPIGLGARDSLRLEGGLCLYGHDIDTDTTPVEAALTWAIQKVRREGGDREGGFPGADVILGQFRDGAARKRVGLRPEGRAPMREGVELYANEDADTPIGHVTSGGFGPTVGGPVAMGYLTSNHSEIGTTVFGDLRGKRLPLTVTKMPFTTANFKR